MKQPLARAARPERELELAVGGAEHLDAVVAAVGHDDTVAVRRPCNGRRKRQLPVGGAAPAKTAAITTDRERERAVRVENMDAVLG